MKVYTKPTETGLAEFYKIGSLTDKSKVYVIRIMPDGEIRCSCPANAYGNICNHIKIFTGEFEASEVKGKKEKKQESK